MSTESGAPSCVVWVTVPATSANLGPGFDCLGLALDLRNEFLVAGGPPELPAAGYQTRYSVRVSGVDAHKVPANRRNLMVSAIEAVFAVAGRRPAEVALTINNCIPVGSGLGSSSSAIVAGLVAGNALADAGLPEDELLRMAVAIEGHPDNVAPALLGGLVLGILPDTEYGPAALIVQRFEPPPWTAVVVLPDFFLPTSKARAVLPPHLTRGEAIFNTSRFGLLLQALTSGDATHLRAAMGDRLHQPHRLAIIPGAAAAYQAAYEAGAAGVALSGAGPSLLAFTSGAGESEARAMSEAFAAAGLSSRAWILQPTGAGVSVAVHGEDYKE
jgi:homoserine kinase